MIFIERQPDGSYLTWGRNATVNGVRGAGGAKLYQGEAARVIELVLAAGRADPAISGG